MQIVKVLKRKDAYSIVVAVLLAMIVASPLTTSTTHLASKISGTDNGYFDGPHGGNWKTDYAFPVVWALIQVVVLEILLWLISLLNKLAGSVKRG